ncbi:MAG: hypothetical protein ACSHWU_09595 [Marinicella sp.]
MSNNHSCAEAMDLMNSRIAIGLLLASFTYGLDASNYLFEFGENQVFKWVGFSITVFSALWIFRAIGPMLWKKIKSKSVIHHEPESFITDSFHKSIIRSWIFTIAVLMLLKVLENYFSKVDLPVEFYVNALIFIMLFSASSIFLVMTHPNEEDDHQEELV